jgi:membrane-bound ClpP family serine protease
LGTYNLVSGIALIIFGFYLIFREKEAGPTLSEEVILFLNFFVLIMGTAMIVGGGLLIRKYVKDRKKSKNS